MWRKEDEKNSNGFFFAQFPRLTLSEAREEIKEENSFGVRCAEV